MPKEMRKKKRVKKKARNDKKVMTKQSQDHERS